MSDQNLESVSDQTNVIQKRKKGRPRKTEVPKEPVEIKEKKRRGRKKKEKPIEEPKQKKKRGRKAAVKYFSSSIRKKIPLTTVLHDNESNILHIDIQEEQEEISDILNLQNEIESADDLIKEYQIIKKNLEEETQALTNYINNSDNHEDTELPELTELLKTQLNLRRQQDNSIIENLENIRKHEVENESTEETNKNISNRKMGYFQLLSSFYDNPTWLTKTDLCCWWCCHNFESIPLGYPVQFIDKIKKFRTRGVFCSFPCIVAYGNEQKESKTELIRYMFRKLTGMSSYNKKLEPAPPRCALKMFGGELTIEEFRNANQNHKIYQMIEYPMIVSRDFISEIDLAKVKSVNNVVFNSSDISRVNKLGEKYITDIHDRVKTKEKNTITTGNTIDKFIKFS
jgi:hypothetical protein